MCNKNKERFISKLDKKYKGIYSLLGEYINSVTKVKIKCNTCNTVWFCRPNDLLSNKGRKCPCCRNYTDEYRNIIFNSSKGKIRLIGVYRGCETVTEYYCSTHKKSFFMTPTSYRRSKFKCPSCRYDYISHIQAKDESIFLSQLNKAHNGSIVALSSYLNTHTKIKFKCLECNFVFFTEPNAILRLSGCPSCSCSKGESTIKKYLIDKGYEYIPQKIFIGCKDKRCLPFDFYLPTINTLIEYDGKQHTDSVELFGGIPYLDKIKKHDKIKNEFAKRYNIDLIRIPYTIIGNKINEYLDANLKE